jgi:pyruvate/2-oxoglutarate dehydrogenase complex dihydrolipoamide acyltransferase (E2) component
MKINVVMPQLGESVSEGEVIRWLKRAGDAVRRDEALVEVKTDKATVEIPAPTAGVLSEIVVPEGETVQVGANIAVIESTSEAAALAVEGASAGARKIEPTVTRAAKGPATSPAGKPAMPPTSKPAAPQASKPVAPPTGKSDTPPTGGPAAPPAAKPATPPTGKPATRPAGKPVEPAPEAAAEQAVKAAESARPRPRAADSPVAAEPRPKPPRALQSPHPVITPLARRIASEFGLDPSEIQGTGEGGRITREDVLNARNAQTNAAPATPEAAEAIETPAPQEAAEEAPENESPATPESVTPPAAEPAEPAATAASDEDEVVALSPIRRRIAARLVQSSQSIPRVTTAIEADMTPLVELRKQHRESYEKAGLKLSYMPFIMKATVAALQESPAVNSSWGGEKLIHHKRVHLGIAVSIEGGLVVPVVRNADDLSVRQLAERLRDVADHARAGKLAADEVRGSTFTITNPGVFGTVFSTPIINPPEAAILAVCRIAETPVAREGKIVIRHMMNLCLSYDHRIIDGETAIQFLQHIRAALEAGKFEMD